MLPLAEHLLWELLGRVSLYPDHHLGSLTSSRSVFRNIEYLRFSVAVQSSMQSSSSLGRTPVLFNMLLPLAIKQGYPPSNFNTAPYWNTNKIILPESTPRISVLKNQITCRCQRYQRRLTRTKFEKMSDYISVVLSDENSDETSTKDYQSPIVCSSLSE
jgi:hypothetical protein